MLNSEMKKPLSLAALGLLITGVGAISFWWIGGVDQAEASAIRFKPNDRETVALGRTIYADNCASCHGVNLEGQPNWKTPGPDGLLPAPPHDPSGHTWHHREELLFGLTKYGIAKMVGNPDLRSSMPAYEDILSDDEIIAVLSFIKSTWPEDIRTRHDEMDRQAREAEKK